MARNYAWHTALIGMCLLLTIQQAALARDSLISQIETRIGRLKSEIQIDLRAPSAVLSVSPSREGKLILIQTRILHDQELQTFDDLQRPDWLGIGQAGHGSIYDSIQFKRETHLLSEFTIQLAHSSPFTVSTSNDQRSLLITINRPRYKDYIAGTLPGAQLAALEQHPADPAPPSTKNHLSADQQKRFDTMMENARQAFVKTDYATAIRLYTKLSREASGRMAQDALEYLGVSRERNKQVAQAKRVYTQYLNLFKNDTDQIRVRQRLLGLASQSRLAKSPLRKAVPRKQPSRWTFYGGFSSYYRYADLTIEALDAQRDTNQDRHLDLQSSLSNDLNVTARYQSDAWDIRSRFSGGYVSDMLDDSKGDYQRLSDFHIDIHSKRGAWSLRGGRQSSSSGGVLGRFDGVRFTKTLSESWRINAVTGMPVDSSSNVQLEKDRVFYGLNADYRPDDSSWEFNGFFIEQRIHSTLDRRAIGGEARYFDQDKSLFTLLDFDVSYGSLNNFLLIGNWKLSDSISINLSSDYRNSPVLTTRNAIQGQIAGSFEHLLDSYSDSELRDIAKDRTAESLYINAGLNYALTQQWQLYANVSLSNFSSMPASAGVEALAGTGNEYSYDVQFIGSSIFKEYDTMIAGLRYFDGSQSKRYSLRFDTRYPVMKGFRINPRLHIDLRDDVRRGQTQWIYKPLLRMDYRWDKKHRLEAEFGGEWSDREISDTVSEKTQGWIGSFGYRYDF